MKAINLNDVTEANTGGGRRLPAGGYVAKIMKVVDVPDKEYLVINYDINEGEYMGIYTEMSARLTDSDWPYQGTYRRSYKPKAAGFFKHFLSCIDKSNGTKYVEQSAFGVNEATLAGKLTGIIVGEEEYEANNGEVRTRLVVSREVPVEDIRSGNFNVPAIKKLQTSKTPTGKEDFMQVSDLPEGF